LTTGILDKVVEFSGPALEFCLLFVVVTKHRAGSFVAFTSMIAVDLCSTSLIDLAYDSGNFKLFSSVYLISQIVSVAVQFWVLYQLVRGVLRPAGAWTRGTRGPFFVAILVGSILALSATLLVHPSSISSTHLLQLRADIFTGLVTCETVIAMMLAASEVGLPWKSHLMAIGQGLMVWALLTVASDGIGAYLNPAQRVATGIYYIRSLIFLSTVLYWTVALWHEEPARKPISPALRKYIVALNDRLQYDLRKAGH
jgi:hypothetical protein